MNLRNYWFIFLLLFGGCILKKSSIDRLMFNHIKISEYSMIVLSKVLEKEMANNLVFNKDDTLINHILIKKMDIKFINDLDSALVVFGEIGSMVFLDSAGRIDSGEIRYATWNEKIENADIVVEYFINNGAQLSKRKERFTLFQQEIKQAMNTSRNVPHEQLSRQVVAEEAGFFYIYLSNESNTGSEAFFDDFSVQVSESFIVQQIDYYPYGMVAREFRRLGDKATNDLFQGKTYEDLTRWYDFHARQYDAAVGRWFGVDPQDQFASPYVGMGNNPVMMVDPDGEFAFLAAALFAKKAIVALKAAKVAKVAVAATKTANASKLASVITKATSTKGLKTGLKSGAINMISNYNAKKGFGWNTLGDFEVGFAGGAFGFGAENKLIGMGVGGLMTWGVNGASFDYEGAQEFVGGALSSYLGMGKAVKGKHAVFKQIEGGNTLVKLNDGKFLSKTLMKHGDNFLKYGIQNNAFDFAYSKKEDFLSRGSGHLDLFAWGGISGAYQEFAWSVPQMFGTSLFYQGIEWSVNGAIKNRYKGIKTSGSQVNKAGLNYYKWIFRMLSEFN